MALAMPRFSGGKLSARMAWPEGCSPPPAAPCRARSTISEARLGASPHNSEAIVKPVMQTRKKRLRPKVLESQPEIGITMALVTR